MNPNLLPIEKESVDKIVLYLVLEDYTKVL